MHLTQNACPISPPERCHATPHLVYADGTSARSPWPTCRPYAGGNQASAWGIRYSGNARGYRGKHHIPLPPPRSHSMAAWFLILPELWGEWTTGRGQARADRLHVPANQDRASISCDAIYSPLLATCSDLWRLMVLCEVRPRALWMDRRWPVGIRIDRTSTSSSLPVDRGSALWHPRTNVALL